jgi:hypothetical protein
MGSRDIYAAIAIVIVFKIAADHLMNEKSKFCILSDQFCNRHMALAAKSSESFDTNTDAEVSLAEVRAALSVLDRAFRNMQYAQHTANQ